MLLSRRAMMKHLLIPVVVVLGLMPAQGQSQATLFEGARLIAGDGTVVDDAAFLVEGNRVTRVGRNGELRPPAGGARVDLTGKTVMPALVELHAHVGYFASNTERRPRASNFTREQLLTGGR